MDYQEEIKALKEYHALCKRHGLKFDRSFEGLMNHPENIKLELIRRRIKQIREVYPLQKKVKKVFKRKPKSNKLIAKKKKASKPSKKEIHGTAAKLKRSEVEAGIKKRKVSKKRKPPKKKK